MEPGEIADNCIGSFEELLQSHEQNQSSKENGKKCSKSRGVWNTVVNESVLESSLNQINVTNNEDKQGRGVENYYHNVKPISLKLEAEKHLKRKLSTLDQQMDNYWSDRKSDQDNDNIFQCDDLEEYSEFGVESHPNHRRKSSQSRSSFHDTRDSCFKRRKLNDHFPKRKGKVLLNMRFSSSKSSSETLHSRSTVPVMGVTNDLPRLDYDDDSILVEDNEKLASVIARNLLEPKTDIISSLISKFGPKVISEVYNETKRVEHEGGMSTKEGGRRRTPGGAFIQLFKDMATSHKIEPDFESVRKFINDTNRQIDKQNKEKGKKNANFRKKFNPAKVSKDPEDEVLQHNVDSMENN